MNDTKKNYNILLEVIKTNNISAEDLLDAFTNWHGLQLFDDDFMEFLKEWAESEYIEKPVISKRDRAIFDYIIGEFKYIARDRDNKLFLYEKEPYKNSDKSWVHIGVNCFCLNHRIRVDFPMVKWEDEEPWLIEDLKKLEVVEEYEYLNK